MSSRPGQSHFRKRGIEEYKDIFSGLPLGCIVTFKGLLPAKRIPQRLIEAHHIISFCHVHENSNYYCQEVDDPYGWSVEKKDGIFVRQIRGSKVWRIHLTQNCILLENKIHTQIHQAPGIVDENTKRIISTVFNSHQNILLASSIAKHYAKVESFVDKREHFLASKGLIPKVERGYT